MQLRLHLLLGVVLGFCVWTSWAETVENGPRFVAEERSLDAYDGASDLEERNASVLWKRAPDVGSPCRPSCDLTSDSSLSRRWMVYDDPVPLNSSLTKRVFRNFPLDNSAAADATRDQYMVNIMNEAGACDPIVPGNTQGTPDIGTNRGQSTAVTRALGNTAFRFAMLHICGCAQLFIVNRQQVYLGHYWEGQCFNTDDYDTAQVNNNFASQVLGFLRGNRFAANGVAQPTLKSVAAQFAGQPDTYILILGPDTSSDPARPNNVLRWTDKVQQMANQIRTTLSITAAAQYRNADDVTPLNPGIVYYSSYVRVNGKTDVGKAQMDQHATGRFLFEYDPLAFTTGARRAYRAIWQKSVVMSDRW